MTNRELAAAAWDAVRHSDDAPWEKLSVELKGKLTALAEKYSGGAKVAEGDYPPEGFAEKCVELAVAASPVVLVDKEVFDSPQTEVSFAEHEDTRIPSPNPKDFDSLKREFDLPSNDGKCPNCAEPLIGPDKNGDYEACANCGFGNPAAEVPASAAPKGKLPADFPGHDVLHEAGINTYGQLIKQRDSEEGLEGVDGIGPSMAAKINERLGK